MCSISNLFCIWTGQYRTLHPHTLTARHLLRHSPERLILLWMYVWLNGTVSVLRANTISHLATAARPEINFTQLNGQTCSTDVLHFYIQFQEITVHKERCFNKYNLFDGSAEVC